MPQSLSKVYIHIIFSTKNRYPYLSDKQIRKKLHSYLGGTLKELDCPILTTGGVADHVHVLCMLSKNLSIAKIIGDIKRSSSKWIKTKSGLLSKFAWQNGYGVFSVGQSELERVKTYILNQEEHHRKKSFQDELRAFFKKYEVEYDEKYVWD